MLITKVIGGPVAIKRHAAELRSCSHPGGAITCGSRVGGVVTALLTVGQATGNGSSRLSRVPPRGHYARSQGREEAGVCDRDGCRRRSDEAKGDGNPSDENARLRNAGHPSRAAGVRSALREQAKTYGCQAKKAPSRPVSTVPTNGA